MESGTTVGNAVKDTQTSDLPIGTVEQIMEAAPNDIVEETIEIPEWGCSVRVRSLTAAQESQVKQHGLTFKGDSTKVWFAEMELRQFQAAVVEPKFRLDDAKKLQHTSGRGWGRIIAWVDKQSSLSKEEMRKMRDEFLEENTSENGVDSREGDEPDAE